MDLKFTVSGRITKPVAEVFEAVVEPKQLSEFFTTGGAKGRLEPGSTVMWDFADFPGAFPVQVKSVEQNRKIVLEWEAAAGGYNTTVTMTFEPLDNDTRTLVQITEQGWRNPEAEVDAAFRQCEGWTGMLAAMRVWLENGLHFREGYYK